MTPLAFYAEIRGKERAIYRHNRQRALEVVATAHAIRAKRVDVKKIIKSLSGKDPERERLYEMAPYQNVLEESRQRAKARKRAS
jgi:hypothetical protein